MIQSALNIPAYAREDIVIFVNYITFNDKTTIDVYNDCHLYSLKVFIMCVFVYFGIWSVGFVFKRLNKTSWRNEICQER